MTAVDCRGIQCSVRGIELWCVERDHAGHLEREATLSFGQSQDTLGDDEAFRKGWLVG